jgi:chemotaxis protein CheX
MRAEYINPFVVGSSSVLEMGARPGALQGELAMQPASFTSQQCNVVCGVTARCRAR